MIQRSRQHFRALSTKASDLELRTHKAEKASSTPSLLERRRGSAETLFAVVKETYVLGVSTHRSTTSSLRWVSMLVAAPIEVRRGRRLSLGVLQFRSQADLRGATMACSNDRPSLAVSHWRSVEGNEVLPLWGLCLPPKVQHVASRTATTGQPIANTSLQQDRRVMKWHR